MSGVTSILKVRRHYSASAAGASSSARRFAGYTQFRDQHPDSELAKDVDGLVGYMRFRDVTSHRGRMFDATGVAGSAERDQLVEFVDRSFTGIHQRDGKRSSTNNLSYYDLIISPEDSGGLDLKALTRATMARLGRDVGMGGLPPWIAAEHRNTRHPHVHVVLAGIRRTPSGHYRTLQITPGRLQTMKQVMTSDIDRQRQSRDQSRTDTVRALGTPAMSMGGIRHGVRKSAALPGGGLTIGPATAPGRTPKRRSHIQKERRVHRGPGRIGRLAAQLAHHYKLETERAIRERKWASDREPGDVELSL